MLQSQKNKATLGILSKLRKQGSPTAARRSEDELLENSPLAPEEELGGPQPGEPGYMPEDQEDDTLNDWNASIVSEGRPEKQKRLLRKRRLSSGGEEV